MKLSRAKRFLAAESLTQGLTIMHTGMHYIWKAANYWGKQGGMTENEVKFTRAKLKQMEETMREIKRVEQKCRHR